MKIHQKSLKPKISIIIVFTLFIINILLCYPASDVYYTIMPGDTIFKIAAQFNVDPTQIIELNKIQNPSIIIPGQVLIISKATGPVEPVIEVKPSHQPTVIPTATATTTATPMPTPNPLISATPNTISSSPAITVSQTPVIIPSLTPTPTNTSKPATTFIPAPTPTSTPKPIGPPEEMKVSVNFINADTKMVLQALAMSMDKKVIMLSDPKQKSLSFKADSTPLLPIMDLILKNEGATSRSLGNTIVIELQK